MSTIGSIFSVARTAIAANQAAMQVASHNIANAETEGYSRQRAEFSTRTPLALTFGSLGTGVDVTDIVRARDTVLDTNYRREAADASGFGLRADLLSRLESVLREPSDTGLSATLDQFWNAWSDLAANPTSTSARSVLRQRGDAVASQFRAFSGQLDELGANARTQLQQSVQQINGQLSAVADLNGRITAAESAGNQAPDLRDARDKLLDSLALLGVSRAEGQSDGTVSVYLGNRALVSGTAVKALEVRGGVSSVSIAVVGDAEPSLGATGSMAALMDFVNQDLGTFRAELDAMARAVVNGVNEYHASGWTAAGDLLGGSNWNPLTPPTGSRVNFFNAAGTTAATMTLSAEVAADVNVIAAGDVQNAPGNTTVANALAALRDAQGMADLATRMGASFATQVGLAPGVSYAESYRQSVADVGISAQRASRSHDVHATLASSTDQRRLSISGVSLDEELTKLMQFQQAYVAATRVIQTVDEMTDALLAMV